MKEFKTKAHIYSLNGEMRNVTVLKQVDGCTYIVDYGGVKCTAFFNYITCQYYVDDKYGIIKENN